MLIGSMVILSALIVAWLMRRDRQRHAETKALLEASLAQLRARSDEAVRKAHADATERRLRVIAFPEHSAPFKQPPWGSTFPVTRKETN